MNRQPIGILDSGVGGLTVVREVLRLLPGEEILYYGDTANCPYGNKTKKELLALAGKGIRFLQARGVKRIALACNTTSSIIEELRETASVPLLGVIEPAAKRIASENLKAVGVFATEFTIASGCYSRKIAEYAPSVTVYGKGSPILASLIERGDFDFSAIDAEIRRQVSALLSQGKPEKIILGCTHYPIVADRFAACYPDLCFLDPAREEALAVQSSLVQADACTDCRESHLTVCSTGETAAFETVCRKLGILQLAKTEFYSI